MTMMTAEAIYVMCAATSLVSAVMLFRQYRHRRTRLLFWSFVGFVGLAFNNVFLFVDLALLPQIDLSLPRIAAGAIGMIALVHGLIWEDGR
jgi:hypothetical protein